MDTINVTTPTGSYPIYIDEGLLSQTRLFEQYIQGDQVCIVTNGTVAPLYLSSLKDALKNWDVIDVILPDGERFKTMASMEQIIDSLIQHRFRRTSTLIALGGGVIGDLTGFAAACYQRGIHFIQVPTTLLAQVDASIGGKTAVNHPQGKNMLGAFHHPQCVVIDTQTLGTLPGREYRAGLAEMIKHGLIADPHYFDDLAQHANELKVPSSLLTKKMIRHSCDIKARIVGQDPQERGDRALLNFGHTFAHGIEKCLGYGTYLHGEAVSMGMAMATDLSVRLGLLQEGAKRRILDLLCCFELPVTVPDGLDLEQLKLAMGLDKKILEGGSRFILLRSIGHGIISEAVPEHVLDQTLRTAGCAG